MTSQTTQQTHTEHPPANGAQPLAPAPEDIEPPKPAAPAAYDFDTILETAEGFHWLFRGTGLTPRDAMQWMKTASAELARQGFKPVRRDLVIPAAPAAPVATGSPSGEAVWIKGEDGKPPRCSLHGPGKWLEGTTKSGARAGQHYEFWACQTRDCKPKGEAV